MKYKLMLGDCLEEMKRIKSGVVGMILTDLPFGVTANKWDEKLPIEKLWKEWKRVRKSNAAIVLHGIEPFSSFLVMSNLKEFKYQWIWNKVNRPTGFLDAKRKPLRITEEILVFYGETPTYNPIMRKGKPYRYSGSAQSKNYRNYGSWAAINDGIRYPTNYIKIKADRRGTEGRIHPTQKPVALTKYLIKTYTDENDIVLDCCMGSGTTGVAAIGLNRRFIGIEKEEKYFNIARERIEKQWNMRNLNPSF